MTTGNLRLAFVIEAIDRATADVARVNRAIDKITEPIRRVRAATNLLIKETKLEQVQKAWTTLGERGQGLLSWARGVTSGIFSIAAAAAAAGYALKATADRIDSTNDEAKKVDLTAEAYQRLAYAAQLAGSSRETMGQALTFLNENMAQAISGSKETALWFERVGIPLKALKKLNVQQVIEIIAERFSQAGDSADIAGKKIALTKALMGRSGAELVQLLNGGRRGLQELYDEADRLGGVISQQDTDNVAAFNDQFDRMKFSIGGALAGVLLKALPLFNDVTARITKWTVANRELIATRLESFFQAAVNNLPAFVNGVSQLAVGIGQVISVANTVAQALGGWQNVVIALASVIAIKGLVAVYGLAEAVLALSGALLTSPIGVYAVGLAALAAVGLAVYRNWDGIAERFEAVWNWVKKLADSAIAQTVGRLFGGGAGEGSAAPGASTGGASGSFASPNFRVAAGVSAASAQLGGVLDINLNADGTVKSTSMKKAPGSPLDLSVGYNGLAMSGF